MLDVKTEIRDTSIRDYTIIVTKETEIIKVVCKRGATNTHSYKIPLEEWRELRGEKNQFNFIERKVPELRQIGISNLRVKFIEKELKAIRKIVNE